MQPYAHNPGPWQPAYPPYIAANPSRVWWVVGGILVTGVVIGGVAYYLATREVAQTGELPTEAPPENGLEGGSQPPFDTGVRAEAQELYDSRRGTTGSNYRILHALDLAARAKGIREGWRGPRQPQSGGAKQTQVGSGTDDTPSGPPTSFAAPTRPDKGPEFWSQADAWAVATQAMGLVWPPNVNTYPDIHEWVAMVGPDGPVEAWLKGIYMREVMRMTEATPEPVDGEEIDWTVF